MEKNKTDKLWHFNSKIYKINKFDFTYLAIKYIYIYI